MTAPKPFRILVTGSRSWRDVPTVAWHLARAVSAGEAQNRPVVLVHGACPTGADAIADKLAREHNIPVERHAADWERFGRAAGPRRNAEMVRAGADVALAFIRDGSRGATGCADLAEKSGITVRRVLA